MGSGGGLVVGRSRGSSAAAVGPVVAYCELTVDGLLVLGLLSAVSLKQNKEIIQLLINY